MKNGAVEFIEIHSQQDGLCKVRNPWKEAEVSIYRNGKRATAATDRLIELKTTKGDRWLIIPKGSDPASLKRAIPAR